jgi:urease accessory protein
MSVVILGIAVVLHWNLPVAAAMALVRLFAVFHGRAVGAEMPLGPSGLTCALGFLLATTNQHCTVFTVGLGVGIAAKGRLTAFSRVAGD